MKSEKLEILEQYREMIKNAWTFQRLTKKEQDRIMYILSDNHVQTIEALKGTRQHCWNILQAIYSSYLLALDYKPIGWRESEDENNE